MRIFPLAPKRLSMAIHGGAVDRLNQIADHQPSADRGPVAAHLRDSNALAAQRGADCEAKAAIASTLEHPALTRVLGYGDGERLHHGLLIQIRLQ